MRRNRGKASGLAFKLWSTSARPRKGTLLKWRLERAIDYIEAHLAEPITLADLAGPGLLACASRVERGDHRSAASRILIRRRIERAQDLPSEFSLTLIDVALSVGFHTQANFTTVFKRFGGS